MTSFKLTNLIKLIFNFRNNAIRSPINHPSILIFKNSTCHIGINKKNYNTLTMKIKYSRINKVNHFPKRAFNIHNINQSKTKQIKTFLKLIAILFDRIVNNFQFNKSFLMKRIVRIGKNKLKLNKIS